MDLFTRDFTYILPEHRIASFPTEKRDQSKLMVYHNGDIHHALFQDLPDHIPEGSLLVFNNSKVIPARLRFNKETGGSIEIFLLNPVEPDLNANQVRTSFQSVQWECAIGNKKRWKRNTTLTQNRNHIELNAELVNVDQSIVKFSWNQDENWDEILRLFGDTPLPPYIKRETVKLDQERYQTVYSKLPGAVAAPTAGLHFTSKTFEALSKRGISTDFLTLHVGAGTFQPIKTERATDHIMHEEKIIFTKTNLENFIKQTDPIIAIGTTSCRSLESLYWYGTKLLFGNPTSTQFTIDKYSPYGFKGQLPSRAESLQKIIDFMTYHGLEELAGTTSIFIYPSYQFMMTDGLVTNFHQPNSTLLLLIAALVGLDWKKIYETALSANYRFLSYGDSSLLLPLRK